MSKILASQWQRASVPNSCTPLVIFHGLFGSKQNWNSISKYLRDMLNIDVICLDLRNHGSSFHSAEMNHRVMRDDLYNFCTENNLKRINLMGHSLGGKVAMYAALQPQGMFSDLIERLIVVDVSPGIQRIPSKFYLYCETMKEIEEKGINSKNEADKVLTTIESDAAVRQFLLTNFINVSSDNGDSSATTAMKFRVNLNAIHANLPKLGHLEISDRLFNRDALFIRGSLSNYIKSEDFPLIKKLFPNSEIETVQNAGHWVHADQPKAVISLISKFLSSNKY